MIFEVEAQHLPKKDTKKMTIFFRDNLTFGIEKRTANGAWFIERKVAQIISYIIDDIYGPRKDKDRREGRGRPCCLRKYLKAELTI